MYFQNPTLEVAIAFVQGYDAATLRGALAGFREWLVVRQGEGNNLSWPAESVAWVDAGLAPFPSPEHFRRHLHDDRTSREQGQAVLLQERLQTAKALWCAALLPPSLGAWFRAAGISHEPGPG